MENEIIDESITMEYFGNGHVLPTNPICQKYFRLSVIPQKSLTFFIFI